LSSIAPISLAEPLALGFSSGLTCVSSCGAVLAPWLVSSKRGPARTGLMVGVFLGGRLVGYVLFAMAVWEASQAVGAGAFRSLAVEGWMNLLLAALVGAGAAFGLAGRSGGCRVSRFEKLRERFGWGGAAVMGVLTGVSVCPPFIAATVRASQSQSLLGSVLFFVVFFLGTSVWFAPLAASGWLRRWDAVSTVARMVMGLVAVYYGYVGILILVAGGK
jgi:hypothetical protein